MGLQEVRTQWGDKGGFYHRWMEGKGRDDRKNIIESSIGWTRVHKLDDDAFRVLLDRTRQTATVSLQNTIENKLKNTTCTILTCIIGNFFPFKSNLIINY